MSNTIEPFLHYLNQLRAIMQREDMTENLLAQRLCPDMFPLHQQVSTAAALSLRCCCPLFHKEVINFKRPTASVSNLLEELDDTIEYLTNLHNDPWESMPASITFVAGFANHTLEPDKYFQFYAWPNFLFHCSMAYAILRTAGLPLSKGDFDGFHRYPPGFSFPS
ncbi:DUF1993 domain-containing protein [Pseudoalteromonas rubra]|uniref:DUF1993 domain-containing protein n=1 Tax=Pseudoalteromonas rubra TaxID=43658 RepID=A0A5S3WUB5_9GAMM|nr:DUF1993 family protein [Pseudoalteromonas rubra]TMP28127.1 DUF1993 domain-containing protein [Pseudoalteromonas rubra]TMP32791.1 DUF1993 domain-containing protein [Pseudoalteromonas rubra]